MGILDGTLAERQRLLTTARPVGREGEPPARSICVIPAGVITSADKAASQLDRIAAGQHVEITSAPALDKGPRALFFARKADTVIMAIEQEVSTVSDVKTLINELGLVGVEPVGFVYDAH